MPDYSDIPLNTEAQLNNWLRFYEMETPLTAVGTFVSAETVSNIQKKILKVQRILQIQETCFSYFISKNELFSFRK